GLARRQSAPDRARPMGNFPARHGHEEGAQARFRRRVWNRFERRYLPRQPLDHLHRDGNRGRHLARGLQIASADTSAFRSAGNRVGPLIRSSSPKEGGTVIRYCSIAILLLLALPAFAQQGSAAPKADKPAENADILLAKVQADKKYLVSQNMNLTEAEAKGFWPLYDSYQKDLGAINKRLADTVSAYADAYNAGPISDDVAKKLTDQYLSVEQDEVNLKKSYAQKLSGVPPPAKTARYLQIETKIRSAVRWDMAKSIPLIQ